MTRIPANPATLLLGRTTCLGRQRTLTVKLLLEILAVPWHGHPPLILNRSGLGVGPGDDPPFSQDVGGRAFQEDVGSCLRNSYRLLKQIQTGELPSVTFASEQTSPTVLVPLESKIILSGPQDPGFLNLERRGRVWPHLHSDLHADLDRHRSLNPPGESAHVDHRSRCRKLRVE